MEKYLPIGWEEESVKLKAFVRGRKIMSASELLQVLITYLTVGKSLSLTAGLMGANGRSISKESLHERMQNAGPWLQWLVKGLLVKHGIVVQKPEWLEDQEVILIDGSDISLKGSGGSDYRLHMAFNLFDCCYKSLEITQASEGEKLQRYEPEKRSISVGDRGYVSLKGIEYMESRGAHFILRYRSKCFELYEKDGKKVDLLKEAQGLKEWESKDKVCYRRTEEGLKPLRICIMRKDEEAIGADIKRAARVKQRKQRKARSEETEELNKQIILCTDLEYEAEKIFELYRCRWQIELVFKELKSTLQFGNIPTKNPNSVKAWFYGKLLIATLSLMLMNESHFSPTAVEGERPDQLDDGV